MSSRRNPLLVVRFALDAGDYELARRLVGRLTEGLVRDPLRDVPIPSARRVVEHIAGAFSLPPGPV